MVAWHARALFPVVAAAVFAIMMPGVVGAADPIPPEGGFTLHVEAATLSIDARRARLADVLRAVARETGIRVWMSDRVGPLEVTERFSGVPFARALERLLVPTGHVLVKDPTRGHGGVSDVFVLASSTAGPPAEARDPPRAEIDPRALIASLPAASLPPAMREAMLDLLRPPDPALVRDITSRRPEVRERLLQALEEGSTTDSPAIGSTRQEGAARPTP